MSEYILTTQALTKTFMGFTAVDGIDLRVRRGSIHALIGPNGAGKTTVFNLLTKFLQPSAGKIFYKGHEITHKGPGVVAKDGLIRSFQISAVFPNMSVLENVRVALQRKVGTSFHFWKSEKSLQPLNDKAMMLLKEVGLEAYADEQAVALPYGHKRALEIATTLAMDPELMLLDEPTQGMGHEDVGRVVALIRRVSTNRTVLMVEHNMNVIANLCDTITVLTRGTVLAEGSYETVSQDPLVLQAYVGSTEQSHV
jgi:branched-chain amino acid transport system ATP-binding protein